MFNRDHNCEILRLLFIRYELVCAIIFKKHETASCFYTSKLQCIDNQWLRDAVIANCFFNNYDREEEFVKIISSENKNAKE
ncbi:hypothetical protein ULVI_13525 [Cochleicola gelatinilyticus]|uniref:Uncharacterized protein n=1 Tax=Cochleicola gelatinilyticus TaxID=1763537 RepID=A0A167F0T4_9FLAO|nr:hypothetical protein ULVI_13525 [Cochleicola gelatinilyticus]